MDLERLFSEQTPDFVELEIDELLVDLKSLEEIFPSVPDLQGEWYDVEMEVKDGEDREAVKKHLETFINKLREANPEQKLAA